MALVSLSTRRKLPPWSLMSGGRRTAGHRVLRSDPGRLRPILRSLKDCIEAGVVCPRSRGYTHRPHFPVSLETLSVVPELLAMHVTGNTHGYARLWRDSAPTLLEVNPFMTRAYFAFMRFRKNGPQSYKLFVRETSVRIGLGGGLV